jgi:tripeptide aminopeptidase
VLLHAAWERRSIDSFSSSELETTMKAFNDPQAMLDQTSMVDRFLEYVRIDTQSDEKNEACPSTESQRTLAERLAGELKELGLTDAAVDENSYCVATLKGNRKGALGFCAHLDTAPAFSGTDVKPKIHENYDGKPIKLKNDVVIHPDENPELLKCVGDTIITSDGTTLLGADDKAGIADIMGALEILAKNPDIPRPDLRICFNPDEEVGRGANKFPLETFGTPVAFTMDGGFTGEINMETFSANKGIVTFTGVSVHPGYAKGKLVNALTYMGKFLDRLPHLESPEATEGRDGFFMPTDLSGDAAKATVNLILRAFDVETLEKRCERLKEMGKAMMAEEPNLTVEVEIKEQYRNMYDVLSKHPDIVEKLKEAVKMAGIEPNLVPIRGGTDGSRLTAMGMPTPNVFAGGMNFHGPKEWICTKAMGYAVCTILNLAQLFAEDK